MTLQTLRAAEAKEKQENGAVIVDIRSRGEFAGRHIAGALSVPLDEIKNFRLPEGKTVIFSCLSGMRTRQNAALLQECAGKDAQVYLLAGGLNAWARAGLPVEKQPGCRLDMMRQVQIAAGGLVLAGVALAYWLSPWFLLLCALVGAGLMFAGISGFCGMAVLLGKMPWNRCPAER